MTDDRRQAGIAALREFFDTYYPMFNDVWQSVPTDEFFIQRERRGGVLWNYAGLSPDRSKSALHAVLAEAVRNQDPEVHKLLLDYFVATTTTGLNQKEFNLFLTKLRI